MSPIVKFAAISCFAVLPVGCPDHVDGNGIVVEEARPLEPFAAIEANEDLSVIVDIDPALTSFGLVVSAESNLLAHIITQIRDGRLSLHLDTELASTKPLSIAIGVPSLQSVSASSASSVVVKGVSGASFALEVGSAGTVSASGSVDTLTVAVGSGGKVEANPLVALNAVVDISSGGSATICVSGTVTGRVSSGGSLRVNCGGNTSAVTGR